MDWDEEWKRCVALQNEETTEEVRRIIKSVAKNIDPAVCDFEKAVPPLRGWLNGYIFTKVEKSKETMSLIDDLLRKEALRRPIVRFPCEKGTVKRTNKTLCVSDGDITTFAVNVVAIHLTPRWIDQFDHVAKRSGATMLSKLEDYRKQRDRGEKVNKVFFTESVNLPCQYLLIREEHCGNDQFYADFWTSCLNEMMLRQLHSIAFDCRRMGCQKSDIVKTLHKWTTANSEYEATIVLQTPSAEEAAEFLEEIKHIYV